MAVRLRQTVTAKDLALGSVTFQGRTFAGQVQGKARERRVRATFPTANVAVPFFHNLGKRPTDFFPVGGKSGIVYSDDPLKADSRTIVLYSNTAGYSGEVIVR